MRKLWWSKAGEELAYRNQFDGLISVCSTNIPCTLEKERSIIVRLQWKGSKIGHRAMYGNDLLDQGETRWRRLSRSLVSWEGSTLPQKDDSVYYIATHGSPFRTCQHIHGIVIVQALVKRFTTRYIPPSALPTAP